MKIFDPAQVVPEAVDEKTLNAQVDQAMQRFHSPRRPAAAHPWRCRRGVPARTAAALLLPGSG